MLHLTLGTSVLVQPRLDLSPASSAQRGQSCSSTSSTHATSSHTERSKRHARCIGQVTKYADWMQIAAHTSPRRSSRRTRTFISLTGPAGNIGDALIRRSTLDWVRGTSDELVVYVGDAPDTWLHQLAVPTDALVLRSKRSVPRWLWMLLTAPRHAVLVFEAGEVPLDRGNALREFVFLAETLIVRLKRGIVVRPPRGIRAPTFPSAWLHVRAARLSQVALWRDAGSAAIVGGRRVVPDLGFAAGVRPGRSWDERDELVVSLRGSRPHPGDAWVKAVRDTAEAAELRIRAVVQVREDEQRARELAEQLGAVFDPWGDRDAIAQEALLRERYDNARLVISDRMHVLVLAALSGAVPVELVPHPTRKIRDAFHVVGLEGVSLDSSVQDVDAMRAFLQAQLLRRGEVDEGVRRAHDELTLLEAEVRATIRAPRERPRER